MKKRHLSPETRARLAAAGRRGGKSTSAAKAAAVAKNGAMPRRDGKPRGWPRGKPRKKIDPEQRQLLPKVHPPGCACHRCIRERIRARGE